MKVGFVTFISLIKVIFKKYVKGLKQSLFIDKCYSLLLPKTKDTAKPIKNRKKTILDILEANPAMPPKPNTAATSAIPKNINDHLSISLASFGTLLIPPGATSNLK